MRLPLDLLRLAAVRQGRAQLSQLGGLAQHPVHVRRNVIFGQKPLSPAGKKDHRRGRRQVFHGGGDFAPPDDATTSVFVEAQITDGRDLTELSVYGAAEAEWLLPPGTKLIVESIQDDNKRGPGRPPAKEWKKVILKQQPVK